MTMTYRKYQIPLLLLSITVFFSCCEPENNIYEEQIIGRWELHEAQRDNRPAPYLEDTYFEFYEDHSLITNFNLTGSVDQGKYDIKDNLLEQLESDLNLSYTIESINDSALILSTNLQNANFRLLLNKRSLQE